MNQNNNKGIAQKVTGSVKTSLMGTDSRIPQTTASLMVGTALFFDFLSVVPVINWIAAGFAWMTFGLWFLIRGVGFTNPKRLAAWGVAALIGVIPALSAFPELTLAVMVTISMVRSEDALGVSLPTPNIKGGPVKGGRSKFQKIRRRASQTPEHNREAARRLRRVQLKRKRLESNPSVDGITRLKTA